MIPGNNAFTTWLRNKRTRALLAGGACLLVLVLALAGVFNRAPTMDPQSTFTVPEPGPLTIQINESGTIRAKEQVTITSGVQGQPTILWLIPEGTIVEAGDLLVELDSSQLEDNLLDQQIKVQNSDAAFVRARENLAVVKNQAQADISQAELKLRFAKEDQTMYSKGEYPKKVKELESRIALAEEELQRARQTVAGSTVLAEEKFISQNELQADQLAARKVELQLELAQGDMDLLRAHTHQRRLDELHAEVEQADMALERINRRTAADIVQAEADLWAREAELEQQRNRLAKIEEQIEKTRITAPRSGLVVYATSTQVSWRGNTDPLAEGQTVRERQHLIYLPTTDAMIAEIKIPEARLTTIQTGMEAVIQLDALPGSRYSGRVTRIAPLPDATSMFMNPDLKVYNTEILLDASDDRLKTGMSCSVAIIAARYEAAIAVPIHTVIRHGNQPVVYVREGRQFIPRSIILGLDDNRMIHIPEGLEPGEIVLLTPPLGSNQQHVSASRESASLPESPPRPEAATQPAGERTRSASGERRRQRE